jgi:hypothetical protein
MNIEDFKMGITQINNVADFKKKALAREYALANNPVKIGDVVSDSSTTIKVEEIRVLIDWSKPSCFYIGAELKKDGTPKKGAVKNSVYQCNIKSN